MSEAYLETYEEFDKVFQLLVEEDKKLKKNPKQAANIAAFLVTATLYSKWPVEKEFKVYNAMLKTLEDNFDNFKELGDTAKTISAYLILASEINRNMEK